MPYDVHDRILWHNLRDLWLGKESSAEGGDCLMSLVDLCCLGFYHRSPLQVWLLADAVILVRFKGDMRAKVLGVALGPRFGNVNGGRTQALANPVTR